MAISRYLKKPSIPSLNGTPEAALPVLKPMKETLEILTGRKGEKLAQLAGTVTVGTLAERVNEIIRVLQDGSDTEVAVGLPTAGVSVPPAPAAPTVDLADLSADLLAMLGAAEERYELILNGNFELCQRYASTTTLALGSGYTGGVYGPDGWGVISHDIGMPADLLWNDGASAPGFGAGSDAGPLRNAVRVSRSTGSVSNNRIALVSLTEGYLHRPWRNSQITLTFKVRSTTAGTHAVIAKVALAGGYQACAATYVINAANTWEEKTVTFSAPPSAGLIADNVQRQLGLALEWIIRPGSGANLTPGTWVSTALNSDLRVAGLANGLATTGDGFELADVHTAGRRRSYEQTVQLARRYFQRSNPPSRFSESYRDYELIGGGSVLAGGNNSGAAGSVSVTVQLVPDMRKPLSLGVLGVFAPGVSTPNRVKRVSDGATITPTAVGSSQQHFTVTADMTSFADQRIQFMWAADAGFFG